MRCVTRRLERSSSAGRRGGRRGLFFREELPSALFTACHPREARADPWPAHPFILRAVHLHPVDLDPHPSARIAFDLNDPKTSVVGAVLKNVVEVSGARGLTLRGLTVTHTAPTFMESYECPSGGDWSIHRGAAVFVEVAQNVTLEGLEFDQVSGNAVMLSNEVASDHKSN